MIIAQESQGSLWFYSERTTERDKRQFFALKKWRWYTTWLLLFTFSRFIFCQDVRIAMLTLTRKYAAPVQLLWATKQKALWKTVFWPIPLQNVQIERGIKLQQATDATPPFSKYTILILPALHFSAWPRLLCKSLTGKCKLIRRTQEIVMH